MLTTCFMMLFACLLFSNTSRLCSASSSALFALRYYSIPPHMSHNSFLLASSSNAFAIYSSCCANYPPPLTCAPPPATPTSASTQTRTWSPPSRPNCTPSASRQLHLQQYPVQLASTSSDHVSGTTFNINRHHQDESMIHIVR